MCKLELESRISIKSIDASKSNENNNKLSKASSDNNSYFHSKLNIDDKINKLDKDSSIARNIKKGIEFFKELIDLEKLKIK